MFSASRCCGFMGQYLAVYPENTTSTCTWYQHTSYSEKTGSISSAQGLFVTLRVLEYAAVHNPECKQYSQYVRCTSEVHKTSRVSRVRVLLVLWGLYLSYSKYSRYFGRRYCSYSQYSQHFGRQYRNTLSTRSAKCTRHSEYSRSV